MNDMEQQINQMNQMSQEHMNQMQQPMPPQQMSQPMGQPQMVATNGGGKPTNRGKRKGGFFSNIYDKLNEIGSSKVGKGKIIVPIVLIGIIAFFWIGWGGNFIALFDGKFGN